MIISRFLSFLFRFAEFVCAAVVMGIDAHFLNVRRKTHVGPIGREIYTIVVSVLSVFLALIWLLPFTSTFMHYPMDFLLSAAWFGVFGALVNWLHKTGCGGAFNWSGIQHSGTCNQWQAAEAFAFLSACFWLASALLGVFVYHKLSRRAAADAAPRRRRRWGRSAV
jgi:hypothetical protein